MLTYHQFTPSAAAYYRNFTQAPEQPPGHQKTGHRASTTPTFPEEKEEKIWCQEK